MVTNNLILTVQRMLEQNNAGFRKVPGTALRNHDGRIVYTPPGSDLVAPLMLTAVEETAADGIETVVAIRSALLDMKRRIRDDYKFYSQDLIYNLFAHPYTKIQFVERDLHVTRLTATRYLDALAAGGFLRKQKIGRTNDFINIALYPILAGERMQSQGAGGV